MHDLDHEAPPRTTESYKRDLNRSLIAVTLGRQDLQEVWGLLIFDMRDGSAGAHGRVLGLPVVVRDQATGQDINLQKWDRLQVLPDSGVLLGSDVTDIHAGWERLPDPARVVFWRRHKDIHLRFPARLMWIPGMKFEYFMLDVMHMIDLGVCGRLIGTAVQRMLKGQKTYKNDNNKAGFNTGLRKFTRRMRNDYRRRMRILKPLRRSISQVGKANWGGHEYT